MALMISNPLLRKEYRRPPAILQFDSQYYTEKNGGKHDQACPGEQHIHHSFDFDINALPSGQLQVCLLLQYRSRHSIHALSNVIYSKAVPLLFPYK